MDPRVIDIPWPLRRLVVSAFVLPRRPTASAAAYRSIWWNEGAPLVVISQRVARAVQNGLDVPVELGMRYGKPSIASAIERALHRARSNVDHVFFVPLYPHYAMSTVETAVVRAREVLRQVAPAASLSVQQPFFDQPRYIEALVASAQPHLEGGFDHLLFSYHGLPERHLKKTDPTRAHCLRSPNCCTSPSLAFATCYRAQCMRTTQAFVERAGIDENRYSVSFQSRLGRDAWLMPATGTELSRLAGEGVRRLRVICPAFVADCLETLEEIGIRGRETFVAAGGKDFQLVPCLNENSRWIRLLTDWCRDAVAPSAADAP